MRGGKKEVDAGYRVKNRSIPATLSIDYKENGGTRL